MSKQSILFLILLSLFGYLLSPLLLPIFVGSLFAALLYPLQVRLENKRVPRGVASTLVTSSVTFGFLLPLVLLFFLAVRLAFEKLGTLDALKGVSNFSDNEGYFELLVDNLVSKPGVSHFLDTLTAFLPFETKDIVEVCRNGAKSLGTHLALTLGKWIGQLPSILLSLVISVLSLFFFLADAKQLEYFVRKYSFFSSSDTDKLMHSFTSLARSVLLASLVSGLAQAFVFWLACLIAGTGNTLLIAFAVFFTSFIPIIGSVLVTSLVVLHQFLLVDPKWGLFLLVASIAVMIVDNVVRPIVIKGAGHIHPLLAFVTAFGGLQVFGMPGVFLGPLVAGILIELIDVLKNRVTRAS